MIDPHRPQTDMLGRVLAIIGLVLQAALLPFVIASGLVAPLWGVIVITLGWALLLFLAIRLWNRAPRWIILIPVATIIWWLGAVSFGENVLGWTA
jgi:hypothetical protein